MDLSPKGTSLDGLNGTFDRVPYRCSIGLPGVPAAPVRIDRILPPVPSNKQKKKTPFSLHTRVSVIPAFDPSPLLFRPSFHLPPLLLPVSTALPTSPQPSPRPSRPQPTLLRSNRFRPPSPATTT